MFNKTVICKFSNIKQNFLFFCNLRAVDELNNSFKVGEYKIVFNVEPITFHNLKDEFLKGEKIYGLFCIAEEKSETIQNEVWFVEKIEFSKVNCLDFELSFSFESCSKITANDFKNLQFSEVEQFKSIVSKRIPTKQINF